LGVGNRIEAASLVHKNKLFDT